MLFRSVLACRVAGRVFRRPVNRKGGARPRDSDASRRSASKAVVVVVFVLVAVVAADIRVNEIVRGIVACQEPQENSSAPIKAGTHPQENCLGISEVEGDYCAYLATNCDFGSVVSYLRLYYCAGVPRGAQIFFACLLLAALFFMMGQAADSYFCPVLGKIAKKLHMSDEIAGMTILALGNGSADVSATFAAVTKGNFGIAIGELLGSGMFITTMVVAGVALSAKTDVDRIAFLRDVSFYLVGVVGIIVIVFLGKVVYWEAILLIVYYLIYVGFSVAKHYYDHHKQVQRVQQYESLREEEVVDWINPDNIEMETFLEHEDKDSYIEKVEGLGEDEIEFFTFQGWRLEFLALSPFKKFLYIATLPFWVPLAFTIPNTEKWNRILHSIIPTLSPALILFATGYWEYAIPISASFHLPIYVIVFAVGLLFSVLVFFTTKWETRPKYYIVFIIYALPMSITWIFIVATELVGLLQSIGVVFSIPSVILGATVLTWGNSISDSVSNLMMARHGAPRMAISASFGGPFFNMFIGLGFALTYQTLTTLPTPYLVDASHLFYITCAFLLLSLVSSLISIPLLSNFVITRKYAFYLIGVYVSYNIVAILSATGVLWPEEKL